MNPGKVAKRRRRDKNHQVVRPATWDGVPDTAIYTRDKWTCRMPVCLCPGGRAIDPRLRDTGQDWAPSIDHVQPLRDGGRDVAGNKRAAHNRCNEAEAAFSGHHLDQTIGSLIPPEIRNLLIQGGQQE